MLFLIFSSLGFLVCCWGFPCRQSKLWKGISLDSPLRDTQENLSAARARLIAMGSPNPDRPLRSPSCAPTKYRVPFLVPTAIQRSIYVVFFPHENSASVDPYGFRCWYVHAVIPSFSTDQPNQVFAPISMASKKTKTKRGHLLKDASHVSLKAFRPRISASRAP